MQIPIYCNSNLQTALYSNNLELTNYTPAYNGESAALDLYNAGGDFSVQPAPVNALNPQKRNLMPTGLHIALPKGYVALIRERGSVTKTPLAVRAGVIDAGYRGEIFVAISNLRTSTYTIPANSKSPFQLIVVPVINNYNIVSQEEFRALHEASQRLEGSVGSSDN